MQTYARLVYVVAVFLVGLRAACGDDLPAPKIGLVITRDDLPAIRGKIQSGIPQKIWEALRAELPKAVEKARELSRWSWPAPGASWDGYEKKDLNYATGNYMASVPLIAINYLVTGQMDGVAEALACMRRLKDYERLGWFTWRGCTFPQIRFGGMVRATSYAYDWLYGAMDEPTRRDIEAYLIMSARDYFRTNLIGPGMLMHHLRHHNQGNNAFCSGLAAALCVGDVCPDAGQWLRAYIGTYFWNLNTAFGPNGQDIEGDLHAYWAIAFDAVTQDAIMLKNVMGIDFLSHPHLARAYGYWMAHLAPCRPVVYHGGDQAGKSAYDENYSGYAWVQDSPASTAYGAAVSNTMLFHAARNRDGGALDVWLKGMMRADGKLHPKVLEMGHTGKLGALLAINWFPTDLEPRSAGGPLYHFSERIVALRSGLEPGRDSLLTFNGGQVNLIERGEQLGTGVGLVWHNPHFHYASAQICLWTEGEDLQPGFRLTSSFDGASAKYFSARADSSNTWYYRKSEQENAHRHFENLERDVVRVADRYWVILDLVAHGEPKAHIFTWNTLNTDRQAEILFREQGATVRRGDAALDFHFAEPQQVSFWQNHTNLMPVWYFAWSDLGRAFYAIEGDDCNRVEETTEVAVAGFADAEVIANPPGTPAQEEPPAIRVGCGQKPEVRRHRDALPIEGGRYYSFEAVYSKSNLRQYHNPAWQLLAVFYDADGKALNKPAWDDPTSACLTELDGERAALERAAVSRRVSVPPAARTARFELHTWTPQGQSRNAPEAPRELYIHALRFKKLAHPLRKTKTRFLTILASRARDAEPLKVETERFDGGSISRLRGGETEDIVLSGVSAGGGKSGLRFSGRLGALSLDGNSALRAAFLERFTLFASERWPLSVEADRPVTVEAHGGKIIVKCAEQTALSIAWAGKRAAGTFDRGYYRLNGGRLASAPELIDTAVDQPPADMESYRKGVHSWVAKLEAECAAGENLLRDAAFTASSTFEERFAPALVNDGRCVEGYGDGRLYYNEPPLVSGAQRGYGGEEDTYGCPWAYRVKPCYWLAGNEEKEAWIEAAIPESRDISKVRLLNTCNAGFNDRAMLEFRIDLFDEQGQVVKSVDDRFGKPFPESVSYKGQSYGPCWRYWFKPDTPVPHGEGFKLVDLGGKIRARRIRVTCLRYWGYGAGLNEFQAF